jgi:hypothetical protein
MSTDATGTSIAIPPILLALTKHVRNIGHGLSTDQQLSTAIRAWIMESGQADAVAASLGIGAAPEEPANPSRPADQDLGYLWKTLFLPHGTRLRMDSAGASFYGEIVGDRLMFEGRSVSPRGMTVAIAGEGRNAWRDVYLRFPGARYWKQAICCRHEDERAQAAQRTLANTPPSPADSMAAAAAAMSDALHTTLALVQHCTEQSLPRAERRRPEQHRRQGDLAGDDCAFD